MLQYDGYDEVIKNVYDHNQESVFEYWDELNDKEKKNLLDDLSTVDFNLLNELFAGANEEKELEYIPAPFIPVPETDDEKKKFEKAKETGISHIKQGKVAVFLVAGGQGSRLGFDGPKGIYPVGPVSNKTLFQIHTEKIVKYSKKYGVDIPLMIMTSNVNHKETVDYFEKNNFFGLQRENVIFFSQNMIPSLDDKGKIVLRDRYSIFKNPDGHGGSLTALSTSGALEEMKKRGVETISYFQVDNPLVNIVDPVFIGFHLDNNADTSSKAVKKTYPEEKIGIFVEYSNKSVGVVEYSDLPEEKANLRDDKGDLEFLSGSIAIHLFTREFIEKITSGNHLSLPYHTARKKINAFQEGEEKVIDGFKFEKFVFDALQLTDKNVIFETLREEEFAPVKNASGVDSVETAQELMINMHKAWLKKRNITFPENVKVLEISPLLAVDADDIDNNISVTDTEKIYLE